MQGNRLLGIALLLVAGPLLAACESKGQEIILTPGPSSTAAPLSSPSPTATASVSPTSSPTPPPTSTPSPTSTPTGPAGYSTSCAAGYPWNLVVAGPFVCIQSPISGITIGTSQALSGYAGGSFENNLVIAVRDENNATLLSVPLTYTSPDAGKPGTWSVTLAVPPGQPSNSPGRVVVYFTSPRDGQVVSFDSIEVRFP
jgi:hypothetical protein